MALILEYSQRELKDFTIHGVMHSENVEALISDIILRCENEGGNCRISSTESYIITCAAWLHDVGNILSRDEHNLKSCEIIDELVPDGISGIDPEHVESIKWICHSHPKKMRINEVPISVPYRNTHIRLRYLTAVFRIADAGDISSRRAPKAVYKIIEDQLTKKSKRIWLAYQQVRGVSFLPTERSIIMTVRDKRRASAAIKELKNELEDVSPILRQYNFPYWDVQVVREDVAPYKGRLRLH